MAHGIPARLTRSEGRKFAFTVGTAFAVFGGVLIWRGHGQVANAAFVIALSLGAAGILIPQHLGPVLRAWMGLAHLISKVTTPIFMGVVYFLVLTPAGLIRQATGRSPVRPRGRSGATYWHRVERPASDLERQF